MFRGFNRFRDHISPLYSFEVFKKVSGICLEGLEFQVLSKLEMGGMSSENVQDLRCENSSPALLHPLWEQQSSSPPSPGSALAGEIAEPSSPGKWLWAGEAHTALSLLLCARSCIFVHGAFWVVQPQPPDFSLKFSLPQHFHCASLFNIWLEMITFVALLLFFLT